MTNIAKVDYKSLICLLEVSIKGVQYTSRVLRTSLVNKSGLNTPTERKTLELGEDEYKCADMRFQKPMAKVGYVWHFEFRFKTTWQSMIPLARVTDCHGSHETGFSFKGSSLKRHVRR